MGKKEIRCKFKSDVFNRDKFVCQVCGKKQIKDTADTFLDAHHITKIFDVFIIYRYLLI